MDEAKRQEVKDLIHGYFAEECGVDPADLNDSTNIIVELEGDSLMMLALLEKVCKRYGITIALKVLGKHLMSKPADTIGDIRRLTEALVEHGDRIVDVEL